MYMRRKIDDFLTHWKESPDHMPLIIKGARQIGKTASIPSVSMMDFATVPADLMGAFQLIPYSSAEDAVFKALGVE